ncbi:ankyrin repeat domain-containing protein, partial [Klebsiella pneumoniae]|nr:ankyrin repeat domain-containing protein [Klebsiella pneumoniae]
WLTTNHHTLLLYTLLYKKYKDYEMSKMLIKYFDINNQDREGKTVLFHAVIMGNVPAVKFFIVNGGNVLINDHSGRKAADYAAMLDIENNQTISRMLLSEENKAKKKA